MRLLQKNTVNAGFWQNKSVLVTGHTGFKGGWLSLWLKTLGAKVTGYSLPPPTHPSFFDSVGLGNEIQSYIGDVRDKDLLDRIVHIAQPEIVFHLAAQPLVRASYIHPLETFSTNIQGTATVLESVRHLPSVKSVVMVTTDKVYENQEWVWNYRENDILGGHDPYSASKAASELVIESYRCSFFSQQNSPFVASARAGNVIGGGDWAEDRIIPDIMRSKIHKQPLVLRLPHAVRPWQHVLEPLSGYLVLAEMLYQGGQQYAESWNFGPIDNVVSVTVGDIVALVSKFWDDSGSDNLEVTCEASQQLHETSYLRLDCAKALRKLSWKPRLTVEESVRLTVEWYKAFFEKTIDMKEYSVRQIQTYQHTEAVV